MLGACALVQTCRPAATSALRRCTLLSQLSKKPRSNQLAVQAAWKAVEYVKSGMVVGLGTGSTAAFAVDRIGQLLKDGELKDIVGVPTSIRTYEQALSEQHSHTRRSRLALAVAL